MIRVYIHGRPYGQDIWPETRASGDDSYLKPFLDSRIGEDAEAVLQMDIWNANAYYSYIHRQNVREKIDRPSSAYLAITVCFEKQMCTKVAVLYELLKRVYSQLCQNNIIQSADGMEKFLVTRLTEKEDTLKQITSVIRQNVEKHIASSLEPIDDDTCDTTQAGIKRYAIVDVDSPQFLMDCKTNRVLVSQDYSPKDLWALKLQQQLQEQIRASKTKIELTEKYQKQIKALQEQNKQLQQSIAQLPKAEVSSKPSEKAVPEIPPIEESLDMGTQEQSYKPTERIRRMAGRFRVSHAEITLVTTLLNSVLLVVVVAFLGVEGLQHDTPVPNHTDYMVKSDTIVVHPSHNIATTPPIEVMPDYSKARIDIPNLSAKETNLKIGETYTLAIQNVLDQDYQWLAEWHGTAERDGIFVDNNQLIVSKAGEITISCIDSHKYIVKQRKIKVQ